MADDGGFHKTLRTLLVAGLFAVAAAVSLVMASGRDPGAVAASDGGFRLELPWTRSSAPNT